MNKLMMATLAVASFSCVATAANAATSVYNNSAAFTATLGTSLTDTFSGGNYPSSLAIVNNATMSGYFGETVFESTGFNNWNILNGNGPGSYCAGCNGSFRLSFNQTSVGTTSGVFGVGLDILINSNYVANVVFGDGSTGSYALPTGFSGGYFGITSDLLISSIHVAPVTGPTTSGAFALDALTIGSAATSAVPEPATWGMMILGFGVMGAAMRRRRQQVRVTYA